MFSLFSQFGFLSVFSMTVSAKHLPGALDTPVCFVRNTRPPNVLQTEISLAGLVRRTIGSLCVLLLCEPFWHGVKQGECQMIESLNADLESST